ncbi:MAG: hypothetical protein O3C45_03830 [Bacteroidetes bacterium]|nr:hypothetical protein [Bacteroidota bacterium]MDA0874172.1 hypothetical protein [Bacteroidota bacterium]
MDTPLGILTADGRRYHTRPSDLEAFAPDVLQRYGLDTLLRMAAGWSQLPTALALFLLLALLLSTDAWVAVSATLLTWLFCSVVLPSVVFPSIARPVTWLVHPVAQGLLFVGVLSLMAASGHIVGVWIGLAVFILLRWQLPERLLGGLVVYLRRPLSGLPPDDAILRNLIVRLALRHGYDVGGTDQMQQRILEIMNRRRPPRN